MSPSTTQSATENDHVTKAAGLVGSATLLSRIFGFVRDVVIAGFFGAGLSSDAFFVAFRIPNLMRRLFAEGSLSVSFIPVFTEYLANQGKDDAFELARSAIRLLSILLVALTIAGIFLSPIIIRVIAPGFAGSPEKLSVTIFMTRIMFPYIFFIGMVALSMGILNVLGHFAAPALAPVLLNISIIGAAFLISPHLSDPVVGLAIGVLIGGCLQLVLQVPFLVKKGFFFWEKAKVYHPGLKKIGLLMLPMIFGSAVYQVNILVGTLLASLLAEGSVSYLYYADRLVQFPLGIFAIATATAVLPSLSRQAAKKDLPAVRDTFSYAMRLVFFITIPSMVGLIVLREPIVALLFKRGAFDAETTRLTAYALLYYAIGLWAFSAVRIVVSTFYSLQDTWTPVRAAVISVGVNILLGVILMGPLKHGGLALATSLASMVNLAILVKALKMKIGTLDLLSITRSVCKTMICSTVMGMIVWAVAQLIIPLENGTFGTLFIGIMGSIVIGMILYGIFSLLLKSQELNHVLTIAKKGMGNK
ncbi:MAG: murein biosynthesis integral membrane protein MurJ [Desulfobacterales bacterium]|nr:MAG: murein biosynthesis integral membrane protein MurJ [Desulfobacterales bacterium]